MNRRGFLGATGLAAALATAAAWRYWPEGGFRNPCLARLPPHLADHDLVRSAWAGIDPALFWDAHAHLLGTGDSGSGIRLNPQLESVLNPLQYVQRLFYLNAGCVHAAQGRADRSYVERMRNLVDGMRPGTRLLLFAFDANYDEKGQRIDDHTSFYVPNDYAAEVARAHPQYFRWVASIHPYRRDGVEALRRAHANGAVAIKWLPAAQGMNPGSPLCDAFYNVMAELDMPLISHAGEELAVLGGNAQEHGNPLLLRRPLEHGVRVVVAHCASLGAARDLDRGADGPLVENFKLLARLLDDARHAGRLFGDISAVTQWNRAGPVLKVLLSRQDWHGRLLNGSDYPLPGVMPLFSVNHMVELGLLPASYAPVLNEIRQHNPLLFDFVLKRHLSHRGQRFRHDVFHTRPFFETRRRPAVEAVPRQS